MCHCSQQTFSNPALEGCVALTPHPTLLSQQESGHATPMSEGAKQMLEGQRVYWGRAIVSDASALTLVILLEAKLFLLPQTRAMIPLLWLTEW